MLVEVFGPGCRKCETLLAHAREAAATRGGVEVVKVSDYAVMATRGILSTPALAVDGTLKSQGKVLTSEEILGFLQA